MKNLSESEDSDVEEKEQEKREEERRKLAAAHHQRINKLLEVPPGIDLFNQKDKLARFKYFTFQDLSLEDDFGYARCGSLDMCSYWGCEAEAALFWLEPAPAWVNEKFSTGTVDLIYLGYLRDYPRRFT